MSILNRFWNDETGPEIVEWAVVTIILLVAAMVGVHTLIGVGEGVLTALVVGSVVAVRPDLVHGARRIRAASIQAAAPAPSSGHRA